MVVMFLGFEQVHRQQFKAITHKVLRSYRTETKTFPKPHKLISNLCQEILLFLVSNVCQCFRFSISADVT